MDCSVTQSGILNDRVGGEATEHPTLQHEGTTHRKLRLLSARISCALKGPSPLPLIHPASR